MADQNRMTETTHPTVPARPTAPAMESASGNAEPEDVRAEIEMTRARMSETIDEIEDVLLRKKEEIQSRMDVTAKVREKPMQSAMAALAAGLALGLLTGGEDEADVVKRDYESQLDAADRRAKTWESRARRLMRLARRQEHQARILALRAREAEQQHHMHFDDLHLPRMRRRQGRYQGDNGSYGNLWNRLTDTVSETARGIFARA